MQRSAGVQLRRWQREALARFEGRSSGDFLTVATPGAGKTTFALAACVRALRAGQVRRVVVVTPTQHLKQQWADAARALGLALEPEWAKHEGRLPPDQHGAVVTYQQLAGSPRAVAPIARGGFAVLDEVHHAAESRSWGEGVRIALGDARVRLSLSGTPFRSDQNPIPFVRYENDRAQPDYEYGYAQALADRAVVRQVFFPRIAGQMEWTGPDGSEYSHGFEDRIGAVLAGQRLRTALSVEHEWLPDVLGRAHRQLEELRRADPRAGGMVIAMHQSHARGIAKLMREQLGVRPALATSDDPKASAKIWDFSRGDAPWLVAVRMVSEGVDIPRLRVGVYATHTVTELFFRQAVGRLVRSTPGPGSGPAFMFIPDDHRLRAFASHVQQERHHYLRRVEGSEDERGPADGEAPPGPPRERPAEQLSLFEVISAVATTAVLPAVEYAPDGPAAGPAPGAEDDALDPAAVELPLEPLAALAPDPRDALLEAAPLEITPLAASGLPSRSALREQNAERAQLLARRAGMTHAAVNAELNRRVGVKRVSEATALQLQRRLTAADSWLKQLGKA